MMKWLPAAVTFLFLTVPAVANDDIKCVQQDLIGASYSISKVSGTLSSDTVAAAASFAKYYPDLQLSALTQATAASWCAALSTDPAKAILADRALPSSPPPQGTWTPGRGINFRSPLVTENLTGFSQLHLDYVPSIDPGRIVVDVDPSRVRSGKSSIRMHLLRGDCGGSTAASHGNHDDCEFLNERVSFSPGVLHPAGEYYYGFSVMLGQDILALQGFSNQWNKSEINLFQWFQDTNGSCFNLQYSTRWKGLDIDLRCPDGKYSSTYTEVQLKDSRTDVWQEFVVHANWSYGKDGYFRVLQNGSMVFDYEGQTLATNVPARIDPHPQIYAYGGGKEDDHPRSAADQYRTAITVWFDDMIISKDIKKVEAVYKFATSELTNFAAALPVIDLTPKN